MAILGATPYLIIGGKAREAIALYERALGARVESLKRLGDVDQSCPEAQRDLVMHAELRVGNGLVMLSDGPGTPTPPAGGAVSVALGLDDEAQTRTCFNALAAGGTAVQPIFDSPWGSLFGIVRDQFGIVWMLDCAKKA